MTRLSIILLLFHCVPVAVLAAQADPLFESTEIIEITLTAPFGTIDRERDSEAEYVGVLTYLDASGAQQQFDVSLAVRGNWRLRRSN